MSNLEDDAKEKIKQQIARKIKEKKIEQFGYDFTPYKSRIGGLSWQEKLERAIIDNPEVMEFFIPAANSSGKTQMMSYLAVAILNGQHPICERFKHKQSIHIVMVTEDKGVLRDTVQRKFEEMTNGELTARGFLNKDRYKITCHDQILKTVTHLKTRNILTFSSTKEGATGLVGVRPDVLLCDEPVAEDVYKELAVRTTEEGTIFIQSATIVSSKHVWLTNLCQDILKNPTKSRMVITASMLENPFVPMDKIDHLREVYGETSTDYRVRVLGELHIVGGRVLDGIENCIVSNDYIPTDYTLEEAHDPKNFIWVESCDYGVGETDPTFIGYFKCYTNGEIVMEKEIVMYQKPYDEWIAAMLKARQELDMPYYYDSVLDANSPYLDVITGIHVRKPHRSIGDRSYLARKTGMNTTEILVNAFARRKIFTQPSSGDKIENGIVVVQNLITNKKLLIKERCENAIYMGKSWVMKVSDTTGKNVYHSPHDHIGDILRYMCEAVPNNQFVMRMKEAETYYNKSKAYTRSDRLRDQKKRYNF